MGASTFQCIASGDSLQDAYQNAVQSAVYSHGHEPYNGTISTTDGVVDRSGFWMELMAYPGMTNIIAERAWAVEAYNHLAVLRRKTEKYGPCWGAKVESGKYIFAGWASS